MRYFIILFTYPPNTVENVGSVSISITIFNKAVLSYYGFNNANTLALGQAIFSLIFLQILKGAGQADFPNFSFTVAFKAGTLMISFVGMVVTGLASLAFVNIAMYTVLRRLTTFVTLAGEYYLLKRAIPQDEQASVIAMVFGAILAGWCVNQVFPFFLWPFLITNFRGDLEFSLIGYILIFINCLFTAWYLISIKQTQSLGLNTFALMYYNNIVALPMFFILALMTERQSLLEFDQWTDPGFIVRPILLPNLSNILTLFH